MSHKPGVMGRSPITYDYLRWVALPLLTCSSAGLLVHCSSLYGWQCSLHGWVKHSHTKQIQPSSVDSCTMHGTAGGGGGSSRSAQKSSHCVDLLSSNLKCAWAKAFMAPWYVQSMKHHALRTADSPSSGSQAGVPALVLEFPSILSQGTKHEAAPCCITAHCARTSKHCQCLLYSVHLPMEGSQPRFLSSLLSWARAQRVQKHTVRKSLQGDSGRWYFWRSWERKPARSQKKYRAH